MSGAVWAVIAGVGFGLFQTLNRRAVSGMDVYLATFLQLLISALVLVAICIFTVDLSLLRQAPIEALISFALAGFIHFFTGWTFLNMSQKRIGAARTSPLIGATPLFATVIAAVTLHEVPDWLSLVGIVLIVAGVYVVSTRSSLAPAGTNVSATQTTVWRASLFGLAAAFCWALSPVFTREGLKGLSSPLLGVTTGVLASALAYGLPLLLRYRQRGALAASTGALDCPGLDCRRGGHRLEHGVGADRHRAIAARVGQAPGARDSHAVDRSGPDRRRRAAAGRIVMTRFVGHARHRVSQAG